MKTISIQALVDAPREQAWKCYSTPKHIEQWNFASEDWRCPRVSNDLRVGGSFNYRMESVDGAAGFDFEGRYTRVEPQRLIEYELADKRKVVTEFSDADGGTRVEQRFDAEDEHSAEQQRAGWQAILDRYARYAADAHSSVQ